MPGSPDQQIQQDRRKVDALLRQPVVHATAISALRLGGDDATGLEPLQSVGQDVAGDAFARLLKLLEGVVAANHQITHDQQRPAIAENLQANIDRASGTMFGLGFPGHQDKLTKSLA
jgi:hypothetical protein